MSMPSDMTYEELIAWAKTLPPMTPEEREVQSVNFSWGNVALSYAANDPAQKTLSEWRDARLREIRLKYLKRTGDKP